MLEKKFIVIWTFFTFASLFCPLLLLTFLSGLYFFAHIGVFVVTGPGGQFDHHMHHARLMAQGASPDSNEHQYQYVFHQMSYHNMFTPSREPGTAWRCRSCGKEVTNRWHHFHSHTPQRSVCPYCPASYSRIDTLRSHLRMKHADRLKNH